jgi:hypothetical protein
VCHTVGMGVRWHRQGGSPERVLGGSVKGLQRCSSEERAPVLLGEWLQDSGQLWDLRTMEEGW